MMSVFKKLNLGTCTKILVLNAPESFEGELETLQDVKVIRSSTKKTRVEFCLGFAITLKELEKLSQKLAEATEGDGVVWVAYPKGSSKKYSAEFNRDCGWSTLGDAGFEAVRQVSIDEDWSALRFRRVEYIKSLKRNKQFAISKAGKQRADS